MRITGAHITKEIVVPEHVIHVLDEDAYWILDYQGNPDPDGGFLYAKPGFLRLSDAQAHHSLLKETDRMRHDTKRPRHRVAKGVV